MYVVFSATMNSLKFLELMRVIEKTFFFEKPREEHCLFLGCILVSG